MATTLVAVLKSEVSESEASAASDEPDLGLVDTYKLLVDIVRLKVMPVTILRLLTAKIGLAGADSVSSLKLNEAGEPKDKQALHAISWPAAFQMSAEEALIPVTVWRQQMRSTVALSFTFRRDLPTGPRGASGRWRSPAA